MMSMCIRQLVIYKGVWNNTVRMVVVRMGFASHICVYTQESIF